MASALPRHLQVQSTSAIDGGQSFAGINQGTINYAASDDKPYLKEVLNTLPTASDAPFNAYHRQEDPRCLPDTRVELLRQIYDWADGWDERCNFWLNGLAGTGKSTIARTVARKYYDQKRLGASFFFSRGGGDISHAGKLVTSIAVQLASNIPSLSQYSRDAINESCDIASQSLRDQWQQLVLRPLSKLSENSDRSSYVVVIDALDECDNANNIKTVVHLLAEARYLKTIRLRILLTSRPETSIRREIGQMPDEGYRDFVLHNILPSTVDHDLSVVFKHNFKLIREEHYLDVCWPDDQDTMRLIQIAGGLFIWAATACRFIGEGRRFAAERLNTILQGSTSAPTAPEKHLDEIYRTVLKQSVKPEYTDEEKEKVFCMLRITLGSIVVLLSPLSASSLSRLLHFKKGDIDETLSDLHSVLDVPKGQSQPLRLHHPSFRDFLLNNDRCRDKELWVDEKQAHQVLAERCIWLMSVSLKQYICGVDAPGTAVSDVDRIRVEQCLSAEVQYACRYWIEHVRRGGTQLYDDSQVHVFLREHLLHWLEALGWMGKVSEGVHGIVSLDSFASSSECPGLWNFIHDAKRFILYNRQAIEQAPLQIYYSALIFTPTTSIVKKTFEDRVPSWALKTLGVRKDWGALLLALEGHINSVDVVAFSPDGKQLASASRDRTVKLWDPGSGSVLQTLKGGHSKAIWAVAFSPDGKQLASASRDRTVKLWDPGSGSVLQTLKGLGGHSSVVEVVAFSLDGKTLALILNNETVKLWEIRSGSVLQTFEGHTSVDAIAFSPDGKTLALILNNETVKLWEIGSGSVLQTFESPGCSTTIAFSPDSRQLALASHDLSIRLCDIGSGSVLQTFEGDEYVDAMAFSPDGKILALAFADRIVQLWDSATGERLQTLEGHSDHVNAVAFSPDSRQLASASDDMTIRLWDTTKLTTGTALQIHEGYSGSISAIAISPDGKQLASASDDTMVLLLDRATGEVLRTLYGHDERIDAIAFSPDGKQLASAAWADETWLWDTATGAALQTIQDRYTQVRAVVFSPDSKQLASASRDKVRLWDLTTGAALATFKCPSSPIRAVAFSQDGKQLASVSDDSEVDRWDVATGAILQTLHDLPVYVRNISASFDGFYLETDEELLYLTPSFHLRYYLPDARSIFVEGPWVTRGMENLLWLPPDYRPTHNDDNQSIVAVREGLVVLGLGSGRLLILELSY